MQDLTTEDYQVCKSHCKQPEGKERRKGEISNWPKYSQGQKWGWGRALSGPRADQESQCTKEPFQGNLVPLVRVSCHRLTLGLFCPLQTA